MFTDLFVQIYLVQNGLSIGNCTYLFHGNLTYLFDQVLFVRVSFNLSPPCPSSWEIAERRVTAVIEPSGCGKSTHLRVYNRIYELCRDQRATGEVLLEEEVPSEVFWFPTQTQGIGAGADGADARRNAGSLQQFADPVYPHLRTP
jgi:hypothetical protein